MTTAADFRTYADEAMRWARLAGNDRDRLALVRLAHNFRLAASQSEAAVVVTDATPQQSLARRIDKFMPHISALPQTLRSHQPSPSFPKAVGHASGHCRDDLKRLVNANEVVERRMQGDRARLVGETPS